MRPRCGLRAINSGAEFDDIQIELHDSAFGEHELDIERERDFECFADIASPGPEEEVFGELHAERAGAAARASFQRFFELGLIGIDIEAPMGAEGVVLGGDDKFGERWLHFFEGRPLFVDSFALEQPDHHEWGDGGRHHSIQHQQDNRAENECEQSCLQERQRSSQKPRKKWHQKRPGNAFKVNTKLTPTHPVCERVEFNTECV